MKKRGERGEGKEGGGVDLERELETGERGDKDVVDLPVPNTNHFTGLLVFTSTLTKEIYLSDRGVY